MSTLKSGYWRTYWLLWQKITHHRVPTCKTLDWSLRGANRLSTGTLTAERFQEVQNLSDLDNQLGEARVLSVRPAASSLIAIGWLTVVNNILGPCISKLHEVLQAKGANIAYQCLSPCLQSPCLFKNWWSMYLPRCWTLSVQQVL